MSRDDEIDYRAMYPIEGRTRKHRSANPKPQKNPEPRGGFFRDEPRAILTQGSRPERSQAGHHTQPRQARSRMTAATRGMGIVAREMFAKNLDLSVDDVMERLEAMGYEAAPTTISSYHQEIMSVLATMRAARKHHCAGMARLTIVARASNQHPLFWH